MDFRVTRQLVIIGIPLLLLIGVGGYLYYKSIPEPTCFDRIFNQGEERIDCGGPCQPCALFDKKPVEVFWTKVFPVRVNTYDVGVSVKNPNVSLLLEALEYEIRVYDERNVIIARRTGRTFILPGQTRYIIETNIESPKLIKRAVFQVLRDEWVFHQEQPPDIVAGERKYTIITEGGEPRSSVSATIFNRTTRDYSSVEVDVIISDEAKNAIAISKTVVGSLPAGAAESVTFFWPGVIAGRADDIQVLPRVRP